MKKTVLTLILIFTMSFAFANVAFGQSDIFDQLNNSIENVDLPDGGDNPDEKAQTIIGKLINAFLSLFGIIFMVLIILGGYRWMSARGNEEEVKKAKDIIRGAVIGLIVVLASYAISAFVATAIQSAV